MKKRFFTIGIVICFLLTSTIAFAASANKIEALVSGMKINFNGNALRGTVLTAKGVTYLPMDILSSSLGFKISVDTKNKKFMISEKVNKTDLLKKIGLLQSENDGMKASVAALNTEKGSFTSEKAELTKNVEMLQNDRNELKVALDTIKAEKDKLTSENAALKVQIDGLNAKIRLFSPISSTTSGTPDAAYYNSVNNAISMTSAASPYYKNKFIKTTKNNNADTFYKIDLKEGQGLTATIKPQIDSGSMYIYLYNSQGNEIAHNNYIGNGSYGSVNYIAKQNTTVYIKINGPSGIYYVGFYDAYWNNVNAYDDQRDFFGSIYTAKKITQDNIERKDANLEDYYRVDVKENQTFSAGIVPQIDSGSMYIYLYNSQLAELEHQNYIGNGSSGTVTKKASADGTYFIRIAGSAGKYQLAYSVK